MYLVCVCGGGPLQPAIVCMRVHARAAAAHAAMRQCPTALWPVAAQCSFSQGRRELTRRADMLRVAQGRRELGVQHQCSSCTAASPAAVFGRRVAQQRALHRSTAAAAQPSPDASSHVPSSMLPQGPPSWLA